MPDLPQKKVGIIACSGEELPEGTISRLAALRVLENLRPQDTVTICLPLFLAGGQGDRPFAKFHPTITIDGCEKRCAARSTEMYSNRPAAEIIVTDLIAESNLPKPAGIRDLDEAGIMIVEETAQHVAAKVDEILGKSWSRSDGRFKDTTPDKGNSEQTVQATCSCGSGIPIQDVVLNGKSITIIGLPLMMDTFAAKQESVSAETARSLLNMVKIYNEISPEDEELLCDALLREYADYLKKKAENR